MHLTGVRIAELPNLDVRNQQASQTAVKEDEINSEPIIVDPKATLAAEKRKVISQLQQEVGKVLYERFFHVCFGIFVLEVQEFENEWIFDCFFRCHQITSFGSFSVPKHRRFVL